MHLLRFISYEKIASQSSNPFKKVKTAARLIKKLEISYFIRAVKGKFSEKKEAHVHDFTGISGYLLSKMDSPVEVVVDYGCGPAFISFELSKQVAERSKNSLITYLVDIDTLILEFAKFRFRKYGLKVETIVVTNEDMYPKLPKHDICIVTEVLEHVPKPEEVAKNIVSSLNLNGLLYGSLDDHTAHTFHISPDLQKVRDLLDGANVLEIGPMLRKAVSVAE
jgi:2-polyprenyl-3-methyl-5-hydroxy-6-metoxy-1,4-benzoquinol methylase